MISDFGPSLFALDFVSSSGAGRDASPLSGHDKPGRLDVVAEAVGAGGVGATEIKILVTYVHAMSVKVIN